MDSATAKTAIEARLGRALGYFEPSNATQIAADPEEVKALMAENCPEELEPLRDLLAKKGKPPGHVILTVAQAQQLIATPSKKEKGDAK